MHVPSVSSKSDSEFDLEGILQGSDIYISYWVRGIYETTRTVNVKWFKPIEDCI